MLKNYTMVQVNNLVWTAVKIYPRWSSWRDNNKLFLKILEIKKYKRGTGVPGAGKGFLLGLQKTIWERYRKKLRSSISSQEPLQRCHSYDESNFHGTSENANAMGMTAVTQEFWEDMNLQSIAMSNGIFRIPSPNGFFHRKMEYQAWIGRSPDPQGHSRSENDQWPFDGKLYPGF